MKDLSFFTPVSQDEFENIKYQTSVLYLFSHSALMHMSVFCSDSWGYGLFDPNGILLRLSGTDAFLEFCSQHSLEPGTNWSSTSIGHSAIGVGLDKNQQSATSGPNHQISLLQNVALYFSPISLDTEKIYTNYNPVRIIIPQEPQASSFVPEAVGLYGGIAIISFLPFDNARFSPLVEATAREITTELSWYNYDHRDFSNDTGHISIDQSRDKNQITVLSRNIIRLFKLSRDTSYHLKSLDSIIKPLPLNPEFWGIVDQRKLVVDYPVVLETNHQLLHLKITTHRGIEYRFNMKEFIIDITVEHVALNPAQYAGNVVHFTFQNIVCQSQTLQDTMKYAESAAATQSNILLTGESGVGKDVVAQAIHSASSRRNQPFIAVNCAVLSKELIASELFGYEPGAFTGANKGGSIGKFGIADQGTLFLDEIGDMPLDIQAHLLRVIEQKSFTRVGGTKNITVDVRIIAATNVNLAEKVAQKLFRADLYFRLCVVSIPIPSLRHRHEDIVPLAQYFIENISSRLKRPASVLSVAAKAALLAYSWPGNVRELQNTMENTIIFHSGALIEPRHFPSKIFSSPLFDFDEESRFALPLTEIPPPPLPSEKRKPRKLLLRGGEEEKASILSALQDNKNNIKETAAALGMSRRTLYRRLDEYNLLQ